MPIAKFPLAKKIVSSDSTLRSQLEFYEIMILVEAINCCNGDVRQAAKNLDIGLSSIYRKISKYNLFGDQS